MGHFFQMENQMSDNTCTQLIDQLEASQNELVALLHPVAPFQDWQPAPDKWSFRYHAAHLATVEEEAFWERVTRIAAGKAPFFEYYRNTGRDFSQLDLSNSLEAWIATRRRILEFVRALPETRLELTGTHAIFGPITVLDVLQIMLNHDREHLVELQQMVATLSFKDHLAR
jgi:hypothetical protein